MERLEYSNGCALDRLDLDHLRNVRVVAGAALRSEGESGLGGHPTDFFQREAERGNHWRGESLARSDAGSFGDRVRGGVLCFSIQRASDVVFGADVSRDVYG